MIAQLSAILTLLRRELLGLWVSPVAWVVLTAFLLLQGGIFYSITIHFSYLGESTLESGPLEAYFGQQSILLSMTLLLLCPALTMRAFAEERRSGTIELLLSAPIGSLGIVLAKYLAVLATYAAIWSPTLLYAFVLRGTGTVDPGALAASYFGLFLVGASYLALGVLASALSHSQMIALVLSVLVQFGLFVIGLGEYVLDPGTTRDISLHLSLTTLLSETSRGIVDSRRVVLHLGLAFWALLSTTELVESWRRG